MTAKEIYENAKWQYFIREHPAAYANDKEAFERGFRSLCDFPPQVKASSLERVIVDYLTWEGHQCSKITTSGRLKDTTDTFIDSIGRARIIGSKTFIPGTSTKGVADLVATIYGLKWDIEIKFSKGDRQRESQKGYQSMVEKAGGIYSIVKNWDDFLEQFAAFLELPQVQLMKQFYNKKHGK